MTALEKFSTEHDRLCHLNDAYSTTGCTCGRDDALDELARLQRIEEKARKVAIQALRRMWVYHVDIDGIPTEFEETFKDRYEKELAALEESK